MKTSFALAMTAAAASAWTSNVEFGLVDVENFTIGLLKGAIEAEVPDVMTCIHDAEAIVSGVETVYNDFKKETFDGVKSGIQEMGTLVGQIAGDFSDCSSGVHGIENLVHMAENFASPWSFAYHVGKDLLVNGVAIYHEVDDAIAKYESSDYNGFGEDIGRALAQVFVGSSLQGFDDDCSVPTGVEFGAACRMRELCGTGCAENKCVWTWPSGSTMDDPSTKCGCQECTAEFLQ